MSADPTAAAAGRNLDRQTKATVVTFLSAGGRHVYLDQLQTDKLVKLIRFKQAPSGEYFGRVTDTP